LWRMCLALLFATLSFYPSRAHLFSKAINESNVLYLPHISLIGATIFWMYRVRVRRRVPHDRVIAVQHRGDAIVGRVVAATGTA